MECSSNVSTCSAASRSSQASGRTGASSAGADSPLKIRAAKEPFAGSSGRGRKKRNESLRTNQRARLLTLQTIAHARSVNVRKERDVAVRLVPKSAATAEICARENSARLKRFRKRVL